MADVEMAPPSVAPTNTTGANTKADESGALSPTDAVDAPVETKPTLLTALTPEIRWHCGPTGLNEAVLSIDFLHANGDKSKEDATKAPTILATGGADKEIKLWRVSYGLKDHTGLEFIFSLSGHDRSVNCVRFSPNGVFLASASDDSTIILWTKPKTAAEDWAWDKITSFSDVSRTLLACGHKGDITDLAWSPDSAFLCSTSVDNTSVIWNAEKGEVEERRKDHTQYVQGVAWDPLNEYLVTEGNDRSCRVYTLNGFDPVSRLSTKKVAKKCMCIQIIKTREFPADPAKQVAAPSAAVKDEKTDAESSAIKQTPGSTSEGGATIDETTKASAPKHRMFLDDTCPAFARRPTWTPDGNYFLAPTGIFRATEASSPVNTVYAFARGNLSEPTLHLPGQEKASLGVRCSPLLYELRRQEAEDGDESKPTPNFFQTPYRSVFAVITLNTVIIYDTQQVHPICTLKDLHYADLTDVSWSRDGQVLSISSMDGYLSFIQFEEGFFGTPVASKDRVAMNQQKMQAMFATPKLSRKKNKTHPTTATTAGEDQNGNAVKTPGSATKKKQKVTTLQARSKKLEQPKLSEASPGAPAPASASPSGVNTLQVRKKRKITPQHPHRLLLLQLKM
uniref:CAF1B/HIR1 beta-propeller domain-containing protein n=1 Tax=Globisporangium ultimum (strain ATCC 200006 / CBS 805.95 / DAOM BR144) TaxID=431595 RepID=K3XC86_GLOUD